MMRRQLKREAGQALILTALVLPLFFAIALLVVDGSRVFIVKRSMQNAADAAALAAARDLNDTDTACAGDELADPTSCLYKVRATVQQYATENGWTGPSIRSCNDDNARTNCYQTPYPAGSTNYRKIQVRLKALDQKTFFGAVVGALFHGVASGFHPAARAVASKGPGVGAWCEVPIGSGTPLPGWKPGDPCETKTPAKASSALLFAHCGWPGDPGAVPPSLADACTGSSSQKTAMHISGNSNVFEGAVWSNGGIQNPSENYGNPAQTPPGDSNLYYSTTYGAVGTTGVDTNSAWWAATFRKAPMDWPVALPTLTCSNGSTGTSCPTGKWVTKVNGVDCSHLPADKFTVASATDPSGNPWSGLYCATTKVTINQEGLALTNAGFVAPDISWSSKNDELTGYTGLFYQYGGILFDAYAGDLNFSGSGDSWTGAIFVPLGNGQVSGGGVKGNCAGELADSCGFVEAQTVQLSGSGGVWHGLGPSLDGASTTTPGFVHPGSGGDLSMDE
jgi:hypothetical protein